jgi:DNA-binding NarL/FixJ family response regulator
MDSSMDYLVSHGPADSMFKNRAAVGVASRSCATEEKAPRLLIAGTGKALTERYTDLAHECGAEITAITADMDLVQAYLRMLAADILIVDLCLPIFDAFGLVARTASTCPGVGVMVVARSANDPLALKAIEAGATGCLLADCSTEDFRRAWSEMRGGGAPIDARFAPRLLDRVRSAGQRPAATRGRRPGPAGELSLREHEVVDLVAKGLSFGEIALALAISPHTMTSHVKNIYRKLAVHSRGEAVYEARCLGLI